MRSLIKSINAILLVTICSISLLGFVLCVLGASNYFWIAFNMLINGFHKFLPVMLACILMGWIVDMLLNKRD